MNIWLGIATLMIILITSVFILIRCKTIRSILLNVLLFVFSSVALLIGSNSLQLWVTILCDIIVGLSLLMAAVHGYNKLFTKGKVLESVGETRRPKSFGNGYWK